ncbi:2,3-bisphosphoglycerate-independent phosphoglycerate mutase [Moraxella sp. ZY210820]|uniref:2,3-bisphosphoglycerate-independent phosphoglycerate mutase n=1 Tax=unclassified Moraxella TaxID=2685852 RepID=UPI002730B019|nr:2,3-bisphosphoglycerate-independent phosphoglycerate mutase [Moraxella sp. ZY210820]WLF83501.1 2,3-bisphosphoglycerate-independent phosphoglycerate mutase [Moraxella sp. ZY210820]
MTDKKIPHVLIIMDGIGHREDNRDNAYASAKTPTLDMIKQKHPHGLISTTGEDVGLPAGQMGNSEVGHMNLGAGRIVYQDFTLISKDIREGGFFQKETFINAVEQAKNADGAVHIFGLLSQGGVHSHEDHIMAMCELALQRGAKVYLHAFLDGRDTPPKSAEPSLQRFEQFFADKPNARLATMIGRYFAMDRDNRWERVEQAYRLITEGVAERVVDSAVQGLQLAYEAGETDEFVKATRIGEVVTINDGDSIVFMNFRSDRARELTKAFVIDDFDGFTRQVRPKLSDYVTLTRYQEGLPVNIVYKPQSLDNGLGEYLAKVGKTQLRLAETEKYPHVSFFFSGGIEQEYTGEKRILIPSPKVATYDLQPEMSAYQVTDALIDAINSGEFDVFIVNYANGDMVGHTGVFEAAVKAVETVDTCLARVYDVVMAKKGHMIITADHGNVEQMMDYETGQVHTQHTTEPVPFIYVGQTGATIETGGILADVAPTILALMNVPQPKEMSGRNLIHLTD